MEKKVDRCGKIELNKGKREEDLTEKERYREAAREIDKERSSERKIDKWRGERQ